VPSVRGAAAEGLIAARNFERAAAAHLRALKAGFDPSQPRDDRGRWTDTGASARQEPPPEVPKQRPETAYLRNRVAIELAKWAAKALLREAAFGPVIGTVLNIVDTASWLYELYPSIKAYLDEPRTLGELQEAAQTPEKGYDIHHIVEKTPARDSEFPESLVQAPENLVRIPRFKHWEINGWFQTPNKDFGRISPRDYLRDKDWDVRAKIGRDALIDHGVMKP
jgi:hypothetical protein